MDLQQLVDWFGNVEIGSDLKSVELRSKTAQQYLAGIHRATVPRLLRLLLFRAPSTSEITGLTEELIALDDGFPPTNNTEILRLMAGIIMLAAFESGSSAGDAFALGLHTSSFPNRSTQAAQPAIL